MEVILKLSKLVSKNWETEVFIFGIGKNIQSRGGGGTMYKILQLPASYIAPPTLRSPPSLKKFSRDFGTLLISQKLYKTLTISTF